MTHVPMLDLKAQYMPLREEIENAFSNILDSGRFVLGENVASFEKEIAAYHGVIGAVGLASGTDALHLSLKSLDITSGDEVITTPFTFIATAEAITYVNAKPVFVDIDRNTLNMDPAQIEDKITERTKAILIVHLFGQPAEMDEIMAIARRHNLRVVEDCAQSFGAKYEGAPIGSFGDTSCFSFYPSKNLGAHGDGGMMISDNAKLCKKVELLRNHGTVGPYIHDFIGFNSRLDEIQAAILRIKFKYIDEYIAKRRNLASLYTSILNGVVQCPLEIENRKHVYHQYTIRTPLRDKIQQDLADHAISSVVYYPMPLHLQKAFDYLGYGKGSFPEAEAAAEDVLSLPIYPELAPETVDYIGRTIVKAVQG
ncbi:MAG: DegT/DnrJ/EryC1/StrS family aminotransferase [Nitrospiraceae bacterium]|nr:MAG: DegT/DnrJ/EryC1/StrS family aminotransferase [Nitrospiraceae bacterium]